MWFHNTHIYINIRFKHQSIFVNKYFRLNHVLNITVHCFWGSFNYYLYFYIHITTKSLPFPSHICTYFVDIACRYYNCVRSVAMKSDIGREWKIITLSVLFNYISHSNIHKCNMNEWVNIYSPLLKGCVAEVWYLLEPG